MDTERNARTKNNNRTIGLVLLGIGGLFLLLQIAGAVIRLAVVNPIERIAVRSQDNWQAEMVQAQAEAQAEIARAQAEAQREVAQAQAEVAQAQIESHIDMAQAQAEIAAERARIEQEIAADTRTTIRPLPNIRIARPLWFTPFGWSGHRVGRNTLGALAVLVGIYLLAKRDRARLQPAMTGPAADQPAE